jgi:NADH:ubiquinone reductase (H+-translocating)
MREAQRVVIVGGGFAGLNCARQLSRRKDVSITLIDRRNYHLFQPLLYQVAMAGLSPGDIASPIRGLFSSRANVHVVQGEVEAVLPDLRRVLGTAGDYDYDYLVLATGAQHAYFGHEEWEDFAPGLKTLEQATEIRRRVLSAFERAETERDLTRRRALLTFVVVGGGPTGVELAGAIGEMTRFTLAKDFRNIDPKLTRIVLIEAGPRILPSFDPELSSRATTELERLGVQLWTNSTVTHINADGVFVGQEHLASTTVLWAAGVQAGPLGAHLGTQQDRQGRVHVGADLSVPGYPEVLVLGDQAHFKAPYMERPLPGVASVAIQQGQHAAEVICADLDGRKRTQFRYLDKGQMATIGRRRAVMQRGGFRSAGVFAWALWLLVHIYFLSGFRNRLFVLIQWSWSYLTFARGTRLIVEKEWRFHASRKPAQPGLATRPSPSERPGAPPPESARVQRASVPPPPPAPLAAPAAFAGAAFAGVAAMTPVEAAPEIEEAATGTWVSPLDGWDDTTTAYPPVRGT